ncbi:MAG: symmetrical bis(5-nucleosyl)-tetraphosphatase, partial [Paucimonas sp.]|nr:symmetrical bis(5-nucleosyl)-tetraphosphatase [Paucimonas sp.]
RILEVAAEVESVLRSDHWRDFLQHMYGNSPARWKEDLQGADRLRCIVNALTRMRYCLADGTMVFGEPQTQEEKETWLPWFDLPDRRTEDITIAFGHWSMLGLMIRPNLLGLDTGCVWGGKLTAICLEDRSLVQVECPQHQKPD